MKKVTRFVLIIFSTLLVLLVAVFGVRMMLAKLAIDREQRSGPIQEFKLETTSKLEIIPLYEEANIHPDLISGHGVSYLIRTNSATILMDVGDNPEQISPPPFAQNLRALGISADEIDAIVISHPHPDHVGGFTAWNEKIVSFGQASGEYADSANLCAFGFLAGGISKSCGFQSACPGKSGCCHHWGDLLSRSFSAVPFRTQGR